MIDKGTAAIKECLQKKIEGGEEPTANSAHVNALPSAPSMIPEAVKFHKQPLLNLTGKKLSEVSFYFLAVYKPRFQMK